MNTDYRGRHVTIMGLGHFGGGAAAARWLARQGAMVTVTDLADENALADSLALLADVPIAALHLGGHREEDFQGADLVVVNPAVRPNSPWLQVARQSGARLRTEIELFIEACPAQIVGVTGSNGKSTTAAMIASILRAQGGQSHFRGGQALSHGKVAGAAKIGTVPCAGLRTLLGGNIGGSLLEQLPEIGPSDWVVLEISSFQLWHFSPGARMPHVAVVTGCTPNHLDWHETFDHYAAAKQRILVGQTSEDIAVLNTHDPEVASWPHLVRGRLIPLPPLEELPSLSLPGEHNRVNAACAAAAAMGAGCGRQAVQQGLQSFRGLPQRLQWLAAIEGRQIYNDSTATTPESTIAALQTMEVPVWLLAGGKNKGCNFELLATEIARRTRGAAFFGASREELRRCLAAKQPQLPCTAVETMEEALRWCWQRSRPGEAILLSPACASTDQFRNFRQRGERFGDLIANW
jgi:UDP-N-acetylmuramoylalanine--D-glutamate ligase